MDYLIKSFQVAKSQFRICLTFKSRRVFIKGKRSNTSIRSKTFFLTITEKMERTLSPLMLVCISSLLLLLATAAAAFVNVDDDQVWENFIAENILSQQKYEKCMVAYNMGHNRSSAVNGRLLKFLVQHKHRYISTQITGFRLLSQPGPNPTNVRIPKIIGFLTRKFSLLQR